MLFKNILSLDDFVTQEKLIFRLKKYVEYCKDKNTMFNLLFHGLKYSGKKTLVNCLLYDIYGDEINKIENINYDQKIGNTTINFLYHI